MVKNEFGLLKTRRFLPLFLSEFIGLFNDSIFKYTAIMLITFNLVADSQHSQLLVNLLGGLYGISFLLFSITAGQIADKFNRVQLILLIKLIEIVLIVLGIASFYFNLIYLTVFVIFLMGIHTAFFGPIKYSMLPDLLSESELLGGNGLVAAGSILALLAGSILAIFFSNSLNEALYLCFIIFILAIISFYVSLFIPTVKIADPSLTLRLNFLKDIYYSIHETLHNKNICYSILSIGWGVFVASVLIRQFPIYTKIFIGGNAHNIIILFFPMILGAVVGALMCNNIFKGKINKKYAPVSLFFISLLMLDFVMTTMSIIPPVVGNHGFQQFFSIWLGRHIFLDLFLCAFVFGIYIVPLYASIQIESDVKHRSRIMACNNLFISIFAVASSVFVVILVAWRFTIVEIYTLLSLINMVVAFTLWRLNVTHQPSTS